MPKRLASLVAALALVACAHVPVRAQDSTSCAYVPVVGARIHPANPCAGDSVQLVFWTCGPCNELVSLGIGRETGITLDVRHYADCVIDVCDYDTLSLRLGAFQTGFHRVFYNVTEQIVRTDGTICFATHRDSISFSIGCPPPPPPGPLPYVSLVQIGDRPTLGICPFDSIRVFLGGSFPNGCYRNMGVELLPNPSAGPLPQPPIVRIRVEHRTCVVCPDVLEPWTNAPWLPGLPPGDYVLPLQLLRTDISCDSTRTDSLFTARVPFHVVESCSTVTPPPPPAGCYVADWVHTASGCDATVSKLQPAHMRLVVGTLTPIAGLQGRLVLDPATLRITNLQPIGPATEMHLAWKPNEQGAEFVLFAEHGAPIGTVRDSAGQVLRPRAILDVTLETLTRTDDPPPITYLRATELLASDSTGHAVPHCPTFAEAVGTICAGAGTCDLNHDGVADIRDIVLMVHCVQGFGPCPDSSISSLDCNHDGSVSLDDVMCCARRILIGDAPDDTLPGRPAPDVAVRFGRVTTTASGIDVPMTLAGVGIVGAARLGLSYPADRFEVTGVEFVGSRSDWLLLHEVRNDGIAIGLIGLGGLTTLDIPPDLPLVVHLALKSGQQAGGEVRLASSQFSGRDGTSLAVDLGEPIAPIGGRPTLALSEGQPNPFSRETRFSVRIERSVDADVAVHDLSGRRVRSLYHGRLVSGPHEFVWDGKNDDGVAMPNGLYFYHVNAGGDRGARKVILLRAP